MKTRLNKIKITKRASAGVVDIILAFDCFHTDCLVEIYLNFAEANGTLKSITFSYHNKEKKLFSRMAKDFFVMKETVYKDITENRCNFSQDN